MLHISVLFLTSKMKRKGEKKKKKTVINVLYFQKEEYHIFSMVMKIRIVQEAIKGIL